MHPHTIRALNAPNLERHLDDLAAILHACVLDGASIGFITPFEMSEARLWWQKKVLPAVADGTRLVLVAERVGRIAGTVQLDTDTPANQPHRAEVRKLLVHPEARRTGLARALMAELELRARTMGRSLLTLDTRTGDAAEPLYRSLGYEVAGQIPYYCRDTFTERLDPTTVMWKRV